MAHELAGTFQEALWISEFGAVKEPDVDVGSEGVDVGECRVPYAGGRVAVVASESCTGCLTCVRICPFGVPQMQGDATGVGSIMGAAFIEAAVCQGCGSCVAECPAQAIQLMHYTDAQIEAKTCALLDTPSGFVPLDEVVLT